MQEELQEQWTRRAAEESHKKKAMELAQREKNVEKIERYFQPSGRGRTDSAALSSDPRGRPSTPGTGRHRPIRSTSPSALTTGSSTATRPARPATPIAPPLAQEPDESETYELAHPSDEVSPTTSPAMPATEATAAELRRKSNDYPTDLFVEPDRPHLVVDSCSQNGVLFAFDSSFLKHQGFRLSMPVACAFSNDQDRVDLVARPLAFCDQSQGALRNAQEAEAGHEQRLLEGQTPEEMLTLLGRLPSLPLPFCLPVPYYVNTEHANAGMSVECHTVIRADDNGLSCLVLIPHAQCALEWLKNVNGVCGPEYRLLERELSLLWSVAWEGVSEQARLKLGAWTEFEPGETFRLYVNDAEFASKDLGLAGMMLTDRRLIYHKFHRHGEVKFSDQPKMAIRPDGDFAALTIHTTEGRVKAARFRLTDLETLLAALKESGVEVDLSRES